MIKPTFLSQDPSRYNIPDMFMMTI